jgi:hypothetical protein
VGVSKVQFLERENGQLRDQLRDMEKNLRINKEIIDNLLRGGVAQEVIKRIQIENANLTNSLKKAYSQC